MSTLYAFKNKLWKEKYRFTYTGSPQPFSLPAGKYLIQCNGARGGGSYLDVPQYGGMSLGIINLTSRQSMYAYVGGDGTRGPAYNISGIGGWNGGGNGGTGSYYGYSGSGGGGASDVRLKRADDFEPYTPPSSPDISLPNGYTQAEYIILDKTNGQYLNTGYIATANSAFAAKASYITNQSDSNHTMALFGAAQNWSWGGQIWCGWLCDHDYGGGYVGPYVRNIYGDSNIYDANNYVLTGIGSGVAATYSFTPEDTYINETLAIHYPISGIPNASNPIFIGAFCNNGNVSSHYYDGKIYYFRIYEKNVNDEYEMVKQYIPCVRDSDQVAGMYETIGDQFVTIENGTSATVEGDPVTNYPYEAFYYAKAKEEHDEENAQLSLLTRFIVAGGGGGGGMLGASDDSDHIHLAGIGGGIVGGPILGSKTITDYGKHASQTDGYAFGVGQDAMSVTQNSGRGGGGGGWFGGYSNYSQDVYNEICQINGAGGSGYVLRNGSYRPQGYDVSNMFVVNENEWFMKAGGAESACIVVSEPAGSCETGDTIIVYPTGESVQINLNPGEYVFKCWGGDGGFKDSLTINNGGYAQGTFTTSTGCKIFANVGGAGVCDQIISHEYVQKLKPDLSFNGGGSPIEWGNKLTGHVGGGASDIRLRVNDLNHRVIVAGGCGGDGTNTNGTSGVGGGTSGGWGTVLNNISPGPGTQTNSPQNQTYPTINGSFGFGGNALGQTTTTRVGGAGGGGWYGGSGSRSDGWYGGGAGNGGSGYVFTSESYVPIGYKLTSDDYLTDTILESGPTTHDILPVGFTKIEIDVVSTSSIKLLTRDADGIKTFNEDTNRWVLCSSQTLNVSLFETEGVYMMTNDDGLLDEYEILVYDQNDEYRQVNLFVTPNKQTITNVTQSNLNIKRTFFNLDYDPECFDVKLSVNKRGIGVTNEIETIVTIDKIDDTDEDCKIYYATYLSK